MKKILVIFLLSVSGKVLGQGIEAELYQYNYSFVHPAFAGSEGQRISMLARTTTYDGSFSHDTHTRIFMSYENYFEKINSGVAFTGYSERQGAASLSSAAFSYNYKVRLGTSAELITSTRVKRHFYSISSDYFLTIDASDPVLDASFSASNWAADLGLLFKVNEFYVGALAHNLMHTHNTIEVIKSPQQLDNHYAAFVGTSFNLGERLVSQHSLYVPFNDEEYRIDLNNVFIIHDLFLAGVSVERSNDNFFPRASAGLKVNDYFQILFLVYSDKRDEFVSPRFRGEVFMGFKF